jgi:hypothetical protein
MLAFRSVVSVLVSFVRSFSTNSRPALRAASGRPPARQRHDGHRGAGLTLWPSRLPSPPGRTAVVTWPSWSARAAANAPCPSAARPPSPSTVTHPDAAIVRSQPGLGVVLGARVLAEFGDDPHRYATAKGRKAFAGTTPVTRSSGLRTTVVRAACNQRLVDACYLWAFAALTASPGARRCYDTHPTVVGAPACNPG